MSSLFVKIDGISADSEDGQHADWFDATTYSFSGTATMGSDGRPSGASTFPPFSFSIKHDANIPNLIKYMVENTETTATVEWRMQAREDQMKGVNMTLEQARVVGVNTRLSEDDSGHVTSETTVQVSYGKIKLECNSEMHAAIEFERETRKNA
jgi:type VI protein secretion system component Hcp